LFDGNNRGNDNRKAPDQPKQNANIIGGHVNVDRFSNEPRRDDNRGNNTRDQRNDNRKTPDQPRAANVMKAPDQPKKDANIKKAPEQSRKDDNRKGPDHPKKDEQGNNPNPSR
jgi:hypothetical protein